VTRVTEKKRPHQCSELFPLANSSNPAKGTSNLQTRSGWNSRSWCDFSFHSCIQSSVFGLEHPQSSLVRISTAAMLESNCLVESKRARSVEKLGSSRRTAYPSLQSQQLRTKEFELNAPIVCYYLKQRWTVHITWTNLAPVPTGEGDYSKRMTYGYLHLLCRT